MWEDQSIQFDGTPYFVLGQKIFDCRNEKIERKLGNRKGKSWLRRLGFVFLRDRSIFIHLLSLLVLLSPLVISTQGHMSPFPLTTTKHDRCKTKDVPIILYCSCRMPWQKLMTLIQLCRWLSVTIAWNGSIAAVKTSQTIFLSMIHSGSVINAKKKVKIPAHVNSM